MATLNQFLPLNSLLTKLHIGMVFEWTNLIGPFVFVAKTKFLWSLRNKRFVVTLFSQRNVSFAEMLLGSKQFSSRGKLGINSIILVCLLRSKIPLLISKDMFLFKVCELVMCLGKKRSAKDVSGSTSCNTHERSRANRFVVIFTTYLLRCLVRSVFNHVLFNPNGKVYI